MRDAEQVQSQMTQAQRLLEGSVVANFKHVIVPVPEGASGVGFEVRSLRMTQNSRIGESIERELLDGDLLAREWSPRFLKQMLESVYFKNDVTEVSTRRIWNDMASFYNFQRVVNAEAFLSTIVRGVSETGFFGYAMGKEGDRYLGFKYGENPGIVNISEAELIIKAETADAKRQFSGLVTLDLTNGTQPIRQVLDEVLANLAGTGARVTVQFDVTARSVNPFPTTLVRTVRENARSLNFSRSEFA